MPVCYFNKKYEKEYDCQYEIKDDEIEVIVKYDIMDEIPSVNGMRSFGSNTQFKNRDILIIDNKLKMNYLLKDAQFSGHSVTYGNPDGGDKTRFSTMYYYKHSNFEKLCEISNGKCIHKIRVYSKLINGYIENPSVLKDENDNEYIIKLKKETQKSRIDVNFNNIDYLEISDNWRRTIDSDTWNVNISINGYIEISLKEEIDYEEVYSYVNELIMYFQLLRPGKFIIDKIMVNIYNDYFELCLPVHKIKYNTSYVVNSVKDKLLPFLYNCYTKIPYRNSNNEKRNIPYIIIHTSRNIEDNFLMFYRFIECYYKQQPIIDIKNSFIKYSIENNYKNKDKIENIENLVQEMISLRNHYVHNGYHIPNNRLYVSLGKIDNKPNPKNYVAKNADYNWILERTKILYKIVIDIIFRNMLGYDNYDFKKHF